MFTKYICFRNDIESVDGRCFANIHIVGNYGNSLWHYKELAKELRKDFPEAQDQNIECAKITQSSHQKGFSLVAYNVWIKREEYEGWTTVKTTENFGYSWS